MPCQCTDAVPCSECVIRAVSNLSVLRPVVVPPTR